MPKVPNQQKVQAPESGASIKHSLLGSLLDYSRLHLHLLARKTPQRRLLMALGGVGFQASGRGPLKLRPDP